ncbi:MAG: GMC family oxidoreductase [Acidibrevibacterium sp.]|jgi:gluconate 2-dehydrogenase alpha chain|uniref:GMC family oxidoreductase n=1 Tax=Acidibrevibacterium fodinaquatile TaxID=1969806 RepID=UPI0023A7E3C4|nr:GMC family oxidoreductase [Acidibrevibacterium fodinaquatile]MCA7118025.1 GMC family oxidoreductase [Acidibrevibacterium fodinaquatile]
MTTRLKPVDAVIIGFGWSGALLAEVLSRAGLSVIALERGPYRDTAEDFPPSRAPDELRYAVRHDLVVKPVENTITFRNRSDQTALPVRAWGSFLPASGAGGGGVHWNGQTWRFRPSDFTLRTTILERYGRRFLPPDLTIQDWGVTYETLEPYYDRFEYLCGISGKSGNLQGKIQPGGNPFEGPRARDYPTPPLTMPYAAALFAKAAAEGGYHPFPQPSANLSQAYTNPFGVTLGACSYCGFCERFGCGNYAKASPQTTLMPLLRRRPNFSLRTECLVLAINHDGAGKKARGVTYKDASGEDFFQPAGIVLLAAYTFENIRLLLLSGIGAPYDPASGRGVVGRNYSYQTTSSVQLGFAERLLNPFIGAGALGMIVDDWNGEHYDHGPLGFIGGAYLAALATNSRPILNHPTPPGTPRWGAEWKRAVAKSYLRTTRILASGSSLSHRGAYCDLDPTYRDRFGRPLLRLTFDFHPNDLRMSHFVTDRLAEIGRAMGPEWLTIEKRQAPYSIVPYQSTHNVGGAIMGTDPETSVVNPYLQSWDCDNLFVVGASAFPQNASYNPTGTVAALALRTADAIIGRYLGAPGSLA